MFFCYLYYSMGYRVVLTKNGEYKKTMHKSKTRETAYINFNRIKSEGEKVFFPKKFINYKTIIPVKYEILIVKDIEDGDKNRLIRDDLGKTVIEQPMGGIWTIIDSAPYDVEETFWVWGHCPKTDRQTIHGVLKKLMVGAYSKTNVKQIIVVHNKLVIHSEDHFEMVICKCLEDAQRLHHRLAKATMKSKIKGLVFMGTCNDANISTMYDVIHDNTGWAYTQIRRYSTRH